MDDTAIKIQGLNKIYPLYSKHIDRLKEALNPFRKKYHNDFYALKNLNFDIQKGEIVGVIGRNGSGKSTLLKIITGVLTPTSGFYQVNGRVSSLLELGTGFNPDLSGIENIYFNATINGLSKEEIDNKIDTIITFADIGSFIHQPVKTYSSGMYVRLAFSIAIHIDPEILIVDEALSVGDAAFQFKCTERLHSITSKGITMLFVSHDIGMVKSLCTRAIYLKNGEIKAIGTPEDMAEIYFMEIRDEQRQIDGTHKRVTLKPSLHTKNGIAFGTDEGYIVSAKFVNTGSHRSIFIYGDIVEIEIETKYKDSLAKPYISLIIQDQKLLTLGGEHFALNEANTVHRWKIEKKRITFAANFGRGTYHITIRLENYLNKEQFQTIDKQVGILQMEIMKSDYTFFGPVNLQMKSAELT